VREQLYQQLKQLHRGDLRNALDRLLDTALSQAWACDHFLHEFLNAEMAYRQERSLAYRLSQAKLPYQWCLETFPFQAQPAVDQSQINGLASLDFVQRAQNLVLIGPPGTGKTGLAISLMRKALLNGYRGRFYNAQDLLDELYASLADRTTSKLLTRLANFDVLCIDELGYLTLKPEQVNAFFKLMEMRYNCKSTIITTNLNYEAWYQLFDRKELVDALLDRLRHHCITIKIEGESLRRPLPSLQ
jgi:DNA replication protein DnaC